MNTPVTDDPSLSHIAEPLRRQAVPIDSLNLDPAAWLYSRRAADFNNDGVVNQGDLDAFLINYSQ